MFRCSDTKEKVKTYEEYLKTKHWRIKKMKKLASFKKKHKVKKKFCECCGKKSTICLHHKTYERVGKERLSDLVYLCMKCHEETHIIAKDRIKKGWDKKKALLTAHELIKKSYKS